MQKMIKILINNPFKFFKAFFKDIVNKFKRFIIYYIKLILENPQYEKN